MAKKIELKQVSLAYKQKKALEEITLTLEGDKIIGILGRNGVGKTSMLSLIASLRVPSSGQVLVDGENPFENQPLMQDIQFVYNPDQTGNDYKVKAMLKTAADYRPYYDADYAGQLVERFEINLDAQMNKLSKGMQAAVEVTIGLASRTPITIFDEAFLHLDAPSREIFYEELRKEQAEHPRMFLISTHLVSEAEHLFDEVVILQRGKLLLHEDYATFIGKGMTVTGAASQVDAFTAGFIQLKQQRLGGIKSVMIYTEELEQSWQAAQDAGLEVTPVSLQELFIHLTEEEKRHEKNV